MIGQGILDFLRDVILNWVVGVGSLLDGIDAAGAGAAVGGGAADAGHFLALFIDPGVWVAVATAWASWIALWLITGLFAIIGRRIGGSAS